MPPRDHGARIATKLAKVEPVHLPHVTAFLEERRANGISDGTLSADLDHLAPWSTFLGSRPFDSATRMDVKLFINSGSKGLSVSYLNHRKITLKTFQRWARGGEKKDPYPEEVGWLEVKKAQDAHRVLVEILTPRELKALIDAQTNTMDRAILAVLYDSGLRASEFCSLRIRDVLVDEYGAVLRLQKGAEGLKTGARHVRIINAVPYLLRWLNEHPKKHDPAAALWLGRSRAAWMDPLTSNGLYQKVADMGPAAGLTRPIWPHLFRHSRATEAAREGWSEAEMRIYFGWTARSTMPSHYIHLAGKDVDENILRRAGKLKGGLTAESPIKVRACICGHENPATSDFCESPGCGKPLTVKAAEKQQANTVQAVLEALKSNPGMYAGLGNDLLRQGVGRASGGG